MDIIKRTINNLNPGQTTVDVCDQPVFALTKEIQFRIYLEVTSTSLFWVVYISNTVYFVYMVIIKGSVLYEILATNNLSIIGTGAIVNANHKQARYFLQVAVCSVYMKLREAHKKRRIEFDPNSVVGRKRAMQPNLFLLELHSELTNRYFIVYPCHKRTKLPSICTLYNKSNEMVFSMDHHHYARWGSVHLFDLVYLHITCPDIYKQFMA